MKTKKKRYALTLLEIMIVIFLIGLIGSVIGYNMKGSLDKGRVFKTQEAQARIREILLLEVAKSDTVTIEEVIGKPEYYLKESGLVADGDKMMKDGWGKKMVVVLDPDIEIRVKSEGLDAYLDKQSKK